MANWHVIECLEGKDKDAYGRLAALGYEVWRPTVEKRVSERWRGKALPGASRRRIYAPLFGRYLFIRVTMSDSVYLAVREQPGVWGWVCMAGSDDPARVPDDLIAFYREYRPQASEGASVYGKGDVVKITGGPFVNRTGVVERVDSHGAVVVGIDIFGRLTPAPFPVSLVELVEQGRRPPIRRDDQQRLRKRA